MSYLIIDPNTGEQVGTIDKGDKIIKTNSIKAYNKLNDEYFVNWKSNKNIQFIKIFRTEGRRHMKNIELSPYAKAFMYDMELYIEYKTNLLVNEKGQPVSNKDIERITKLNNKTISKVLKELEEKLVIKIVGNTNNRKIYINPYLFCAGNMIQKDVVLMFEDYRKKYNIDINYYINNK